MENSFYHNQIFGSIGGISMPIQQAQADDAGNYDAEAELRCPRCECATLAAEHCAYCNFDLVQWALSLQQSNVEYVNPIEDALKDLKENYT